MNDNDLERIVEALPPDTQRVFREQQRLAAVTTRNVIHGARLRRWLLWLCAAQVLLATFNCAMVWWMWWLRPGG